MIKLATIEDKRIEFINDITSDTISKIIECTDRLLEFDKDTEKFRLFKNSYNDLHKLLRSNQTDNLSRNILELLSIFRAFLDHWETFLKRHFGKDSKEYNSFKQATKIEYDNSFAYRFIYELRNYIQHIGLPDFSYHSRLNENDLIDTYILVNKQELIKNHDWKEVHLKDFAQLPDTFDFIPLTTQLFDSVKRINDVAMNLNDIRTLYYSSIDLLQLNRYIRNESTNLAIVEGNWDKPVPQSLNIKIVPLGIADYIVKNIKIEIK